MTVDLSAIEIESGVEVPKRRSAGRTKGDPTANPFHAWVQKSKDEGNSGQAARSVPAASVRAVLNMIRKAAENLNVGTRTFLEGQREVNGETVTVELTLGKKEDGHDIIVKDSDPPEDWNDAVSVLFHTKTRKQKRDGNVTDITPDHEGPGSDDTPDETTIPVTVPDETTTQEEPSERAESPEDTPQSGRGGRRGGQSRRRAS